MQFSIAVLATGDVVFSGHGMQVEPERNVPFSHCRIANEGEGRGVVLRAAVLLLVVGRSGLVIKVLVVISDDVVPVVSGVLGEVVLLVTIWVLLEVSGD